MSEPKLQSTKPLDISRMAVFEAYQKVKANVGAAGLDGKPINEFEKNLKRNFYKLWNCLSSRYYFLPPARGAGIPKRQGDREFQVCLP